MRLKWMQWLSIGMIQENKADHTELESVMDSYKIPSAQDLKYVTIDSPLNWNAYEKITQI